MNIVIGPIHKYARTFQDDILVPSENWSDMILRVEKLVIALRDARLTINMKKCAFAKSSVEYLGFVIPGQGIQPGTKKVYSIRNYPKPMNNHEIR